MNPSGTDTSQLSDRPEREKDTFLTPRIFFSLDRCLLMGNPAAAAGPASGSEEPLARREQRGIISNGVKWPHYIKKTTRWQIIQH